MSRARLSVDGATVAEASASSGNPASVGLYEAGRVLESLLSQLSLDNSSQLDAACAGVAGVGASSEAHKLFAERLRPLTRAGQVAVLSDIFLVLPAAGLQHGVAIICGTGSAALGWDGSRSVRAGGWGYLLGDEASGYWVFRQALRTLHRRNDQGEPLGTLGATLLDATGARSVNELRERFYQAPWPGRWAALAPLVLASLDEAAEAILDEAAQELDELLGTVLKRLGNPAGLPVVLAGGLTANGRFCEAATDHLCRCRPGSVVSVLREPPLSGAVRLAERAAAGAGWPS
jgi:N-acetylglucosamine kinase-like BadF-type ATPase